MENPKVQFNRNSEERRKRRTKVLFIALLLFLMAIAGGVAFLRKADMQITRVTVTGTRALDPEGIQKAALASVEGNYVWVIPRSNTLLFSKRKLQASLLQEFPGIDSLEISFADRNTIAVAVTEKHADNVWCQSATSCYFIDDTGLIYEPSPVFSDGVYTTFSGSVIQMGDSVIRSRFVSAAAFENVKLIIAKLTAYPVSVLGALFDPTGDVSLRISNLKNYSVSSSSLILVASDTTADTVSQDLDLLLADKSFTNALTARPADLQTIDLRFPQKIYYKFKNGTATDTAAGGAAGTATSATTTKP